mmetsp:Transcript_34923/g.57007  ORF Transcript_34923/g.57007 Transcript_34923/m.57007 type:complete len:224 (+) Transcript_34923:588-1259(+)
MSGKLAIGYHRQYVAEIERMLVAIITSTRTGRRRSCCHHRHRRRSFIRCIGGGGGGGSGTDSLWRRASFGRHLIRFTLFVVPSFEISSRATHCPDTQHTILSASGDIIALLTELHTINSAFVRILNLLRQSQVTHLFVFGVAFDFDTIENTVQFLLIVLILVMIKLTTRCLLRMAMLVMLLLLVIIFAVHFHKEILGKKMIVFAGFFIRMRCCRFIIIVVVVE